jgi:predicted metal-dependent hydrolase
MPIRLSPGRPLPPYSYVPGKFPHPIRADCGHSFGHSEPPSPQPTDDNWQTCEPYLWGFDLFNHGYYWEAHETWEAVWHALGRTGTRGEFVKGLIKLAAAGVKAREGSAEGVRRHLARAAELLEVAGRAIQPARRLLGIEPLALAQISRSLREKGEELLNTSEAPVLVVMPIELYPMRGAE